MYYCIFYPPHFVKQIKVYLCGKVCPFLSNLATLLPALGVPYGVASRPGRRPPAQGQRPVNGPGEEASRPGPRKKRARAAQNAFRAGHCEREAPLGAGLTHARTHCAGVPVGTLTGLPLFDNPRQGGPNRPPVRSRTSSAAEFRSYVCCHGKCCPRFPGRRRWACWALMPWRPSLGEGRKGKAPPGLAISLSSTNTGPGKTVIGTRWPTAPALTVPIPPPASAG
jgi:hypothetical protein